VRSCLLLLVTILVLLTLVLVFATLLSEVLAEGFDAFMG